MNSLRVELGDRSYPIFVGSGVLQQCDLANYIKSKQVMIVTNETIAPHYLDDLTKMLAGFDVKSVILPDGEQYKTLDYVNRIFDQLLTFKTKP